MPPSIIKITNQNVGLFNNLEIVACKISEPDLRGAPYLAIFFSRYGGHYSCYFKPSYQEDVISLYQEDAISLNDIPSLAMILKGPNKEFTIDGTKWHMCKTFNGFYKFFLPVGSSIYVNESIFRELISQYGMLGMRPLGLTNYWSYIAFDMICRSI